MGLTHKGHGWSLVWCFKHNPLGSRIGQCVQDPDTYSPQHGRLRLVAIPITSSRIIEDNLNWDNLFKFALPQSLTSHCDCHWSTCSPACKVTHLTSFLKLSLPSSSISLVVPHECTAHLCLTCDLPKKIANWQNPFEYLSGRVRN